MRCSENVFVYFFQLQEALWKATVVVPILPSNGEGVTIDMVKKIIFETGMAIFNPLILVSIFNLYLNTWLHEQKESEEDLMARVVLRQLFGEIEETLLEVSPYLRQGFKEGYDVKGLHILLGISKKIWEAVENGSEASLPHEDLLKISDLPFDVWRKEGLTPSDIKKLSRGERAKLIMEHRLLMLTPSLGSALLGAYLETMMEMGQPSVEPRLAVSERSLNTRATNLLFAVIKPMLPEEAVKDRDRGLHLAESISSGYQAYFVARDNTSHPLQSLMELIQRILDTGAEHITMDPCPDEPGKIEH